mmetsp:Transcript_11966/g.30112  ORF Transcript_11966/g.30112 Transcript_11966/m.30112 type:complete len:214 (-) Transcript_11966:879-1520(-)
MQSAFTAHDCPFPCTAFPHWLGVPPSVHSCLLLYCLLQQLLAQSLSPVHNVPELRRLPVHWVPPGVHLYRPSLVLCSTLQQPFAHSALIVQKSQSPFGVPGPLDAISGQLKGAATVKAAAAPLERSVHMKPLVVLVREVQNSKSLLFAGFTSSQGVKGTPIWFIPTMMGPKACDLVQSSDCTPNSCNRNRLPWCTAHVAAMRICCSMYAASTL